MIYYLSLFVTLIITLSAQGYIKSTYNKTRKIKSNTGMSGYETARKILDSNGLNHVEVKETSGTLTDHYDPKTKTVRLSTDIYNNNSIASIAVAAHECGHALQDKNGYLFLRLRNGIVPLVNLVSKLGYVIIMISLIASLTKLLWIGIMAELVILLFQVITLPVEFNASDRALKQVEELGIVSKEENKGCRKMLRAAALTYVANVAAAIIEILRLISYTRRD